MFITRFAPSPTGYLHLGHAYSAIIAHTKARHADGQILLRIEDIDQGRCRPEYEQAIHDDLAWLRLKFDGPCWRQSERLDFYQERLHSLNDRGLIYRCFKTRKELETLNSAPHGPLGKAVSPGPLPTDEEAHALSRGKVYAWRLNMKACHDFLGTEFHELSYLVETGNETVERLALPDTYGDVVLGRKDSGTSYHLASVHDDIASRVTHIIRGDDLAEAAGLHRLLYALFDAEPPIYYHHKLLTDDHGKRLAKRDHAATLRDMKQNGFTPEEIYKSLGLDPIHSGE